MAGWLCSPLVALLAPSGEKVLHSSKMGRYGRGQGFLKSGPTGYRIRFCLAAASESGRGGVGKLAEISMDLPRQPTPIPKLRDPHSRVFLPLSLHGYILGMRG